MAFPLAAVLGIGSALMGASSASKAAKAQTQAAERDLAFQTETRDIIREDLAPYRNIGPNALAAYQFEMGLGPRPVFGATAPGIEEFTVGGGSFSQPAAPQPAARQAIGAQPAAQPPAYPRRPAGSDRSDRENYRLGYAPVSVPPHVAREQWANGQIPHHPGYGASPAQTRFRVNGQEFATREEAQAYADANKTGGTAYQGFQATPGYKFRFDQGTSAVNALAGAKGGLMSGRTLQDLTKFGQGIASEEYGNYLSRLGGMIDTGVGAASMSGQASQNAAAGASNALSGIGNAKAAGAIGTSNAINNGINTGLGIWSYQSALANPGATSGLTTSLVPRPNPRY